MSKEEILTKLVTIDLSNEWLHLQYYLYHSSAVTGLHREEYKEFFTKAAAGEMSHIQKFQDMIWGLGGNPKILPPIDFQKYSDPKDILKYSLWLEELVVNNYVKRIEEVALLGGTDGKWLEIFLEDQLRDSREDADNIKQILVGVI